jgi:serine/threonine-protein kinase HipA
MNRCPITYQPSGTAKYAPEGLKRLSRSLTALDDFPYSAPEQRLEAAGRMGRMSIQGVQPKLSAVLNPRKQCFEIVDIHGRFIIKPQHEVYPQMPENEDLTMRLAAQAGIETPLHGMIWCNDGSLSYFVRRFDRVKRNGKLAVEDFAQLAGLSRETKYDFTLEKMIKIIETHCTFPVPEKFKFFRLVLFCFLTGNEDMHVKNFSLITRDNRVEFSPAYDLLNSTLALGGAEEEMALMLGGKRKEFRRRELMDYLGRDRLGLTGAAIEDALNAFRQARPQWEHLIGMSFLTPAAQQGYLAILAERFGRLMR